MLIQLPIQKHSRLFLFFASIITCLLFLQTGNSFAKGDEKHTEIKQVSYFYGHPSDLFKDNNKELINEIRLQLISQNVRKTKGADNLHIVLKLGDADSNLQERHRLAKERIAVLKDYFQKEFSKFTIHTEVQATKKPSEVFSLPSQKELGNTGQQPPGAMEEMASMITAMNESGMNKKNETLLTIDSFIEIPLNFKN